MGFLADSEVSNNLFYRTGEGATSADSCCAINISLSERVTVKDNYSYHEVTTKKYKVLYDSGVEDLEKSKNVYVVLNK